MNKRIGVFASIIMIMTFVLPTFSQVEFQVLKGKKYPYEISVPKGKYEYEKSSSEREHWGTYDEPYAGIYAYKDAWYPGGELGAGSMEGHILKNELYEGDELLDYSDTREDIPGGYKYEARFRIKRKDGSLSENYVVLGILTQGKYKFSERIWVEASLVFHKENPDKEQIVENFFGSFKMN